MATEGGQVKTRRRRWNSSRTQEKSRLLGTRAVISGCLPVALQQGKAGKWAKESLGWLWKEKLVSFLDDGSHSRGGWIHSHSTLTSEQTSSKSSAGYVQVLVCFLDASGTDRTRKREGAK
jgi:hypothetical protein